MLQGHFLGTAGGNSNMVTSVLAFSLQSEIPQNLFCSHAVMKWQSMLLFIMLAAKYSFPKNPAVGVLYSVFTRRQPKCSFKDEP